MNQNLRIITGSNVDLISPFPTTEIKRMYGWLHCYRTVTECDDIPQELEGYTEIISHLLPNVLSWGMIDKNHLTNIKHEAPLVGAGIFEPRVMPNGKVRDGLLHVATSRRAWKARLIDEASETVLGELFTGFPDLLRITAQINERNSPAKSLLRRLGFKFEGIIEDGLLQDGQPANVLVYGLTKRNYTQCHNSLPNSLEVMEVEQPQILSQPMPQVA